MRWCYARFGVLVIIVRLACFVLLIVATRTDAQDLAEIRDAGVLRHLGTPFARFVTGNGEGLDVEIVQRFAARLGVRYEYVPSTWTDLLQDLLGRDIEFSGLVRLKGHRPIRGDIIASGMTVLPLRQRIVDFSRPVFPSAVWVAARASAPVTPIISTGDPESDIELTRLALRAGTTVVVENTGIDPRLYGLDKQSYRLKALNSAQRKQGPLQVLLAGESDMALLDMPDIMIAIERWPGRLKVIGPISGEQQLAAVFRKTSPRLREAFDAFLGEIQQNGEYMRLIAKYYRQAPLYFPHFFRGFRELSSDAYSGR